MLKSQSRLQDKIRLTPLTLTLVALAPILIYFSHIRYSNDDGQAFNTPTSPEKRTPEAFTWSKQFGDWVLQTNDEGEGELPEPACIWPDEQCQFVHTDRIVNQLRLQRKVSGNNFKIFTSGFESSPTYFETESCPVNRCQFTQNPTEADAVIFPNSDVLNYKSLENVRFRQIWIAYLLESPINTYDRRFERSYRGVLEFNWTASYRDDSDLVTPYSKFVPFSSEAGNIKEAIELSHLKRQRERNLPTGYRQMILRKYATASDKHKKLIESKLGRVAWFASNCYSKNDRLEYARELAKYIPVDIYGR